MRRGPFARPLPRRGQRTGPKNAPIYRSPFFGQQANRGFIQLIKGMGRGAQTRPRFVALAVGCHQCRRRAGGKPQSAPDTPALSFQQFSSRQTRVRATAPLACVARATTPVFGFLRLLCP